MYCEKEIEGNHELAELLIICGTAESAYATTYKEYLDWCWPVSGKDVWMLLRFDQESYSKWRK